jgi:sugar fermentation stimulation protein A
MLYSNIQQGYFLSRPNRFIAHVEINGVTEICHVKNTGRCRELLTERAVVYVQQHDDSKRKTKYSLIAVRKGNLLINMDSQAPNKAVAEWLTEKQPFGEIRVMKPECRHGNSRFDFYLETEKRKIFIEVKGVTLENDGIAMFPDAPTARGVKHLQELTDCLQQGYEAAVIFVIQFTGAKLFRPNYATHPEFAQALRAAQAAGVQVVALECTVTPESMYIGKSVPLQLTE